MKVDDFFGLLKLGWRFSQAKTLGPLSKILDLPL